MKQTSPRSCCTACHRSYGAEFNGCFAPLRFPVLCLIISSYTRSQQQKKKKQNSPPVEGDICICVFYETQGLLRNPWEYSTAGERMGSSCVFAFPHTCGLQGNTHSTHCPPSLSLSLYPTGEIRDLNDCCLPPPLSTFLSARGTNSTLHSPVSPRQMKP